MFQNKGKGKKGSFKSKSKFGHLVDQHDAFWTASRGKGKGKPSGKTSRPPVNVYAMDYDLGGLEMETLEEPSATLHAAVRESNPKSSRSSNSEGMLDCGATASAAPEVAVHGLIKAVLSQDAGARIDVQYVRPFFRFGNGKWGQALFRATIHSHV